MNTCRINMHALPCRLRIHLRLLIVSLLMPASIAGCDSSAPAESWRHLRVSAIPDQDWEKVSAQHLPLVNTVCNAVKVSCSWVPVSGYGELVERIGRGEIDLAYMGGVTFVQAVNRHDVVPIAMRDIDNDFTTAVVVRHEDPAHSLQDLKGRSFAFGARLSTSGHVMPRYFMGEVGVIPERDFAKVVYSGSHSNTLALVKSGELAAGAVNSTIAYKAITEKNMNGGDLRIIWRTPPYPDYVWGARKALPAALLEQLREAFLDLNQNDPKYQIALERQSAAGYIPTFSDEFAAIKAALRQQGDL